MTLLYNTNKYMKIDFKNLILFEYYFKMFIAKTRNKNKTPSGQNVSINISLFIFATFSHFHCTNL